MRIFVVEDDPIGPMVPKRVARQGFECVVIAHDDPLDAFHDALQTEIDPILVDRLMPGIDGADFIRRLRAEALEIGARNPLRPHQTQAQRADRARHLACEAEATTHSPMDREEETIRRPARAIEQRDGGDSDPGRMAEIIAVAHHGKWDGTGYPDGPPGDATPIEGRIVALVDALCTASACKPARSPDRAGARIAARSGHHFDPACIAAAERIRPQIAAVLAPPVAQCSAA